MTDWDDHQLLAEFARENSEAAFTALVQRHVNLVYSTALRSTGNAHAADEISQAVFIILARKAKNFSSKIILSGWLYQTTRLTAANYLRGEIRRQQREQEAYMQSILNEPAPEIWPQIAPLLDDALGKLGETDRNAIVLRFFENKNLREVGAALGASEDAAKMRVNRALEKLRKIFTKRGVVFSVTAIAGAVSANSVQSAPTGLAMTISATTIKGTSVAATVTTLVKGTLKLMTYAKLKLAVGIAAGIMLAGGATTVALSQTGKADNWTPQEIAQQTQATYAAMTSYSDSGAVVASVAGKILTNTFHIRLLRPDFYRVDWSEAIAPGVASQGAAWSAGDGHFMQMSTGGRDAYPKPQDNLNRQQNLGAATGVSSSASATVPSVFFGDKKGNSPLQLVIMGATTLTKEPDAIIGNADCHVFTSKLDPATLHNGGKLPYNMGVGTVTVTFWIGKTDHLIHQVRQVIDMSHMAMPTMSDEQIKSILGKSGKPVTPDMIAALKKNMEVAYKQTRVGNIIFTETHENIVLDKKFLPADFADAQNAPAASDITIKRMNAAKQWSMGFRMYADSHGGQLPKTFAEAKTVGGLDALDDSVFEIASTGDWNTIADHAMTVLLKEKNARTIADGRFEKIYAFADGHVEATRTTDGDFGAAEKQQGFVVRK